MFGKNISSCQQGIKRGRGGRSYSRSHSTSWLMASSSAALSGTCYLLSPNTASAQWALLGSHTPLQEHSEIKQDSYAHGITWGLLQNQFILLTIPSQFLPGEKALKEHTLCIRAITKLQRMQNTLHKNLGQFVKSLNWGASLYFLK